jgi:hypothetical protein
MEELEDWGRADERVKGKYFISMRDWNVVWDKMKGRQRRTLVKAEGMECWMKGKKRPARKNASKVKGDGMLIEREGKASKGEWWWGRRNGMLNEKKERPAKKEECGDNGMLNEREGKASKGECWWGRREWNAEWDKMKGQQRRMLVKAEGMECWMRQKERPAKENAGKVEGMEC